MKLTALLIAAFTFTASAASFSQSKVNLKMTDASISEIISKIEGQTNYRFLYNANLKGIKNKISVQLSDLTIEAAMSELLKGTDLTYQLLENQLIVINNKLGARADVVVTGKVVDEKGEELIGVSVKIKGTSRGVSTDMNGSFKLSVPENAVLVFTYVGFNTQEVQLKGQKTLKVVLKGSASDLDEVVVVGYGTAKKKDLTGAVTSMTAKQLSKIPLSSTAEAIQGRMPGVQVQATEGSPDAEMTIRVRGGGSISQDNSPLYIVDGFPVTSIANISPTDIASIDILKDASSAAIYGARGANGVFIITTKGGSDGKVSVNYNGFVGMRTIAKYLPTLNPYEYTYYQYELNPTSATNTVFESTYGAFNDLDIYKAEKGRNWQKDLFGSTAFQQNHNVSISGGNKATKYSLGVTRADEDAIMLGSNFQRNNVNFKLNTEVNKYVNVDFITRFAHTTINGAGVSSQSGQNTRLRNAVKFAPTKGLRGFAVSNEDLNDFASDNLFNPIEATNDEYKKQVRVSTNFNAAINWTPISNLRFRTEGGYEVNRNRTDQVWGSRTSFYVSSGSQVVARVNPVESDSWRIANTVNYDVKKLIPGHTFNVMLGQELVGVSGTSTLMDSRGFAADMTASSVLANMHKGTPMPTVTTNAQPNHLASFFGRVNYSGKDKYLASFTFRADGSSKFAEGNQWGYFPSGSVAWRISEEDFMKGAKGWLANLKIRGSLGMAGNNRIDDGLWQMLYGPSTEKSYFTDESQDAQLIPGKRLANPDLKWETTISRNLGVDFGFLNNRISGVIDLYHNTTKDLLIEAPVPANTGYTSQMQNVGQTSNKGIEFSMNAQLVQKKDWGINLSFNIARNWNNVDKFRNGDQNWKVYTSGWNGSLSPAGDFIIQEGKPVGQMFGYVTDGMYSFNDFQYANGIYTLNPGTVNNRAITNPKYFGPGSLKFKDLTVDPSDATNLITDNDKTIIGNAQPKYTGGFNLAGNYKGFDLSVFCNFVLGVDVYNANKLDYTTFGNSRLYQNLTPEMALANRFTIIDPVTGFNLMQGSNANRDRLQEINQGASIWSPIMSSTPFHSWAVEDGSFLRVNNITLGYTLPGRITKKAMIQNLRVYLTAYNLHTFTKYSGFDPEVSTRRETPMTPNVDYSAYPRSRQFVAGINVTF